MKIHCVLVWVMLGPAVLWAAPANAQYDALIRRARGGDHEPALQMLRDQGENASRQMRYDHIEIAGWANRPAEAVAVYESLKTKQVLPAEVQLAVARAYRDLGRWTQALEAFHRGGDHYPQRSAFLAGEIMTLADADAFDRARSLAQARIQSMPDKADLWLALSYVHARMGQPHEALFQADQALALAPDEAYVVREYVNTLSRARLAGPALNWAQKNPDLFSAARLRQLEADAVAQQVRMADLPTRNEEERFVIADRALARYAILIPEWEALGETARLDVERLRIDRLWALHVRSRMAELVSEYEYLLEQGVRVPAYALDEVASAYLYLRQPEKARRLYQQLENQLAGSAEDPAERLQRQIGLYYALTESGQHDQATRLADQVRQQYPTWIYYKGLTQAVANGLKLESEQFYAMTRLDVDDAQDAQQRLQQMVQHAPNNFGLRVNLAAVYLARGWPRAAQRELKLAESMAPRAIALENHQAWSALELQEWRQAQDLSADTLARMPESLSVQRLARDWQRHQRAELRVSADRGLASDAPISGNNDYSLDTVLYTPPVDYNWRAFGGAGYAVSDFEEGRSHYRWVRAGLEWRGRDLSVEGELSTHSYGYGVKGGASLNLDYQFDDHWRVGGSAERRTRNVGLRALVNGIDADRVTAFLQWRAHEGREWRLFVAPTHFSDGNQRWELALNGRERMYSAARLQADFEIELWSQRNTRAEAPYFNPRLDVSIMPAARVTHTIYRHYDTSWQQIVLAGLGGYAQQGYGSAGVAMFSYGQRYRVDHALDVGALLTGVSRPYDGEREYEMRLRFDLTYRF